ncbi:MAG: 6,7-dimethyl-8-ribityllumazine synthase [Lentisphaeria bacterium]|jgi:6,7-dimethyl-8-ribityllumazine synthase|nr:6,7-dimethyl-8-ribityllumazine synthase [Lentisphaeria bacterium]
MNKNVTNVYEGELNAAGLKLAVVCARFNEFFVSKLLGGAVDAFVRHGGSADDISVAWVPGSYELPFAAKKMLENGKYDAVVALGVVIKGATSHADYINGQVSKSLAQLGMDTGIPVVYAVVTTENIEQAIERSGTKAGNRGADAAVTAIEMANLSKAIVRGV